MFESATLKLTGWYLAILMVISLIFSIAIYQLNFHEVNVRLENLQRDIFAPESMQSMRPSQTRNEAIDQIRIDESREAATQMVLTLIYVNLIILGAGGIGSYVLARRTLAPIENAHEAQSRFTSDASHELRTPLAAMKTELEVALRDPHLSMEEARELLESNLEEADKLIKMSEVFLKLARLDYDSIEIKQFDFVATFEGVMKQFSKQNKRFHITARKHSLVTGNEAAIDELIVILIENALKYSPPSSQIYIRIFERRFMTGFEIINEGPAIPAEQQQRIFERFYRGDTSRTHSSQNGYGLGLAIAKKIVDIHHGDIKVNSDDIQTIFTFMIPNHRNIQAKIQNPTL